MLAGEGGADDPEREACEVEEDAAEDEEAFEGLGGEE